MTSPRQVLPGTTYLVTRRCTQRQFLLRPSRLTNHVVLFTLALAARAFGVRIHAFCVLSNHFHLILTDPHAQLPAFHQYLDSLIARALNASLGRRESFWAPNSYSAVALTTPDDVVDKAAYVLANPVAAGLVRSPRQWPGLWSSPESIDGPPLLALRPDHFFDPCGHLPDSVPLALSQPPGFASAADFRDRLAAALALRVDDAVARHGRHFLGLKRLLRQRPLARPARREALLKLNPRIAARDRWKRIEALGRLVEFLRSYREAWAARLRGDHVLFPAGTYLLRVLHRVPCVAYG
jgi:REP element-mobilizing transposase RayT